MIDKSQLRAYALASLLILDGGVSFAQDRFIPLRDATELELHGLNATTVAYKGHVAIKLTEASPQSNDSAIAVIKNLALRDGTIEAEISGAPASGAAEGARGFVGIAFRVEPDIKRFEYIYLRPTNGRAADQIRRNHSVQYASHPDYPWERLRKEEPEKYETYVDLEPGVWTKVRILVSGAHADLYVNNAPQPTLVVGDLKLAPKEGGVALWIGPGTEAYFADMKVSGVSESKQGSLP